MLIGSRCIPNGAHTKHFCEPIWPMLQNLSKTLLGRIIKYKTLKEIMILRNDTISTFITISVLLLNTDLKLMTDNEQLPI